MTMLTESTLLIRPRFHFLLARSFDVLTGGGTQIGEITGSSQEMTLADAQEQVVAQIARPWRILHKVVHVARPGGASVGTIEQVSLFFRIRFTLLDRNGSEIGAVEPNRLGALSFDITAAGGKRWASVVRQYRFFRSGDYEVTFFDATEDQRLLAIGAVVAIDKVVHSRRGGGGASGGGGGG